MSTASNSRSQALNQALSSFAQFAGASDLKGKAYDSAKNYQASVLTPLLQGLIIYTEAVGSAASTLSSTYASLCGGESLDSDQLEAEINSKQASVITAQNLVRTLSKDENVTAATRKQASDYASSLQSDLNKTREKLRKLNEFDRQSSTIVSNIFALEGALKSGTAQVVADFNGFNPINGFPTYDNVSLEWKKTISKDIKEREELISEYNIVVEKAKNNKEVTDKDLEVISRYGDRFPTAQVDEELIPWLVNNESLSQNVAEGLSTAATFADYNRTFVRVSMESYETIKAVQNGAFTGDNLWQKMKNLNNVVQNSDSVSLVDDAEDIVVDGLKGSSVTSAAGKWSYKGNVGYLGTLGSVLEGTSTYLERKDKYGAQSAAIDAVAHTGIALATTYVGSVIGSAIPIPIVGTVAGAYLGSVLGNVLETIYDESTHDKLEWSDITTDVFKAW
ncbi:hypothetical protein JOC28_002126 [Streptococcus loxodontisalivarius]|uniref:LXG domain-containing protein n=1 Tax=Streptococcus loxodontisalivarius TaxID=1349415 RepID=A0ABS2PUR3_9STRE|nr:hypothetical protein [Streptococcus loxodontisalivarius]